MLAPRHRHEYGELDINLGGLARTVLVLHGRQRGNPLHTLAGAKCPAEIAAPNLPCLTLSRCLVEFELRVATLTHICQSIITIGKA